MSSSKWERSNNWNTKVLRPNSAIQALISDLQQSTKTLNMVIVTNYNTRQGKFDWDVSSSRFECVALPNRRFSRSSHRWGCILSSTARGSVNQRQLQLLHILRASICIHYWIWKVQSVGSHDSCYCKCLADSVPQWIQGCQVQRYRCGFAGARTGLLGCRRKRCLSSHIQYSLWIYSRMYV